MSGNTDFVYGLMRYAIAQNTFNWGVSPINAMLVSSGYSPNPVADQYVSVIPTAAIVVRDVALTTIGVTTAGICYGTIPTFYALTSLLEAVALVLYSKTSADNSSPLVYYTSTGPGFPFTPQGYNYVIGFDQSNGGFFQV